MCFSSQQPKPDINKPAYKPNQMSEHFKLTMGNKVIQQGDPRNPKEPKDTTSQPPPFGYPGSHT